MLPADRPSRGAYAALPTSPPQLPPSHDTRRCVPRSPAESGPELGCSWKVAWPSKQVLVGVVLAAAAAMLLLSELLSSPDAVATAQRPPPTPEPERLVFLDAESRGLGSGFNNLWQELVLLQEMARRAGRTGAYGALRVKDGSVWPLETFVAPPAGLVSKAAFAAACPDAQTRTLAGRDVARDAKLDTDRADAEEIVQAVAAWLRAQPERCIHVAGAVQFFNLDLWYNSTRLLPLWPALSASPVLTQHAWAPAVYAAVAANTALLTGAPPTPLLPALAALHVRRGDYDTHCAKLAAQHAPFAAWNRLPALADASEASVLARCWPSVDDIAARLGAPAPPLARVFVMTNADAHFVAELRAALLALGWEGVTTSRDLVLDAPARDAGQVVDMEIGVRAGLFIGNGFSTMTSSVVALRLVRGAPAESTRLW